MNHAELSKREWEENQERIAKGKSASMKDQAPITPACPCPVCDDDWSSHSHEQAEKCHRTYFLNETRSLRPLTKGYPYMHHREREHRAILQQCADVLEPFSDTLMNAEQMAWAKKQQAIFEDENRISSKFKIMSPSPMDHPKHPAVGLGSALPDPRTTNETQEDSPYQPVTPKILEELYQQYEAERKLGRLPPPHPYSGPRATQHLPDNGCSVKSPEIPSALENLNKTAQYLHSRLTELSQRLESVTAQSDQIKKPESIPTPIPRTALSSQLENIHAAITSSHHIIDHLLANLEL